MVCMLFLPFEFMFVLPMFPVQKLVDHNFGSKTVDVYREANGLVGAPFFFCFIEFRTNNSHFTLK